MPSFEEGIGLYDRGQATEAERVFRALLHAASYRLGLSLLRQGRYAEAWPYWEHRPSRLIRLANQQIPEWTGEPLDGRSVLVLGEQGLGDELMFARFLPPLRLLRPKCVVLGCLEPNVRALQHLADVAICRLTARVDQIPKVDCWTLLGSLPHRLGITPETVPGAPYLRGAAQKTGGVGVVGQGRPQHPNDKNRSIPVELLLEAFPNALPLMPAGDMQDTLDTLSGLDRLITVDTSWAHAAGALGKPVSILLPAIGCDWRWGLSGDKTPWYPSATLYRQDRTGDWASVLERLVS